ncbi:hypothetical protein Pyn_04490 [Prunus yedoensis var. nudiflora]|uniref:Uncharacterized protein n=1 Tax=Prunus yedoensis var. nudiflora TaxID=2094558 RepID=A0A314ZSI9_PRUYE|nr:hypothetical protein Pyn_04490 [Prunus yedoensis var. nudiflora]
MGANLSTFKRSSSSSAASQRLQQAGGGDGNSSPAGPSCMELLKPECLKVKAEKKTRKRPLTPERKKIHNNNNNTGGGGASGSGTKLTTLEEWLLASPGHHGMKKPDNYNITGGELNVFRPHSRRVHPASSSSSKLPADHVPTAAAPLDSKATDSICLERFVKNDQINDKLKKKVSFRLPEEADIIIFYPSEEIMAVTDSDSDDEDYDIRTSTSQDVKS